MENPQANLPATNLEHTCLILLALGHAVTQLSEKRVDDTSGLDAIPQCYDDLMAGRCKGDIKSVADA
ncbi:hypothetical protein BKM16_20265 [Pseudomonas amygdali pv. morsprunorum]|uniref:Uncharacterized protein n=1 Tax=Pseudomonas amygdali pv. lachrymans str. M301315 TaxID=629260 RepID=A0AAD0LRW5_PSEAV|nr:hypothetical protein BKM19_001075 [Pseudomonas amygdali pv. morsprunorum]AXH53932.1 hypothetical protein PLA107_000130 [Pseudomonas amygdali pv. lachrymans str. M301315]PWD00342.1 hypothetical protein CX658_20210 [Pseudomonas amygdali pv. lachrymans]KWS61520.1 hypothetical protein AL056_18710 [Pseudomonas amygdali pv. morsprunorum]KWS68441.1 hypothetical protein AL054_19950 [Pseudomonas amygdali pv. morsprunorum]